MLNEVVVPIHIIKVHLHKSERMTVSAMVEMEPEKHSGTPANSSSLDFFFLRRGGGLVGKFRTGFLYVAIAVLEITSQTRLTLNTQLYLSLPFECCKERCTPPCEVCTVNCHTVHAKLGFK